MKKFAKLIPALALLLVSFVTLSTASYAWFSMNTTVTASNMEVTATTPVNLLIANSKSGSFGNSATADEELGGKILPASSADGKTFNAIEDGNYLGTNGAGGVATADTTFEATSSEDDSVVVAMDGDANGYWAVYSYAVKLSQAQDNPVKVGLSKLTVAAKPATNLNANLNKAVRVAVYTGAAEGDLTTLLGIYAINGADTTYSAATGTYAKGDSYVSGKDTAMASKVVYAAEGTGNIALADANCVAVNGEKVYLTLVVWVEGQDTNCVNANAGATLAIEVSFGVKNN